MYDWEIIGGNFLWELVEVFDGSTPQKFCVVWHAGKDEIDNIINETSPIIFAFKTDNKQEAINFINEQTVKHIQKEGMPSSELKIKFHLY